MHACAVLSVACLEHTAMGMQAAVRRQERGVNVEHSAEVGAEQPRRQNTHETRERDHIRLMRIERGRQRALEGAATCGLRLQHRGGFDTQLGGAGETWRVGAIRDYHRDPRGPPRSEITTATCAAMLPARQARAIALMFEPRPEMRMASLNGVPALI